MYYVMNLLLLIYCETDIFNAENDIFDVILVDYKKYDALRSKWSKSDYSSSAPISCIADLRFRHKQNPGVLDYKSTQCESVPFQFIAVCHTFDEALHDFAEAVISGFDMSCCQFAIDCPHLPAEARGLTEEGFELFKRRQFTYDMKKFRSLDIMGARVSKYLSRGYSLVGLKMGNVWSMEFEHVRMRNRKDSTVYDGDAVYSSMIFNLVKKNPNIRDVEEEKKEEGYFFQVKNGRKRRYAESQESDDSSDGSSDELSL